MPNHLSPFRDHPTDFVLTSARALGLTDAEIIDCAHHADTEPELIEDKFDFVVWMIFSLMREYDPQDHAMLVQELRDLMTGQEPSRSS